MEEIQAHQFEKPAPDDPADSIFRTVNDVAKKLKPEAPVQCIFPEPIRSQARKFQELFPGTVMYAVKCNPGPEMLRYMYDAGIRHFDVASAEEVRLVADLFPDAVLHFMHPVKSRQAIRLAYKLGVRSFALDSASELMKILEETRSSKNLRLFVRLAVARNDAAAYDLSGKFGAAPGSAAELLRHARKVAAKLGVCFHVGSQCMHPDAYRQAIGRAIDVVAKSKVKVDIVDVGGGFPSSYPGMEPPPLENFMAAIVDAAQPLVDQGAELWCEPGRAMVAEGASMLVRVTLRKGRRLYINDGTYGSLFDAGMLGWRYPVRLVRPKASTRIASNGTAGAKGGANTRIPSEKLMPFVFYGPTCDNLDKMKGPFMLPEDTQEGDWIEIGMLGAYGSAMQTRFNGFHSQDAAIVWPEALTQLASERARRSPMAARQPMMPHASMHASQRSSARAEQPAQLQPSLNAAGPDSGLE